ncbi:MAG: imidazole glycerol phosphate synthase subunit HisF [Magnetococcales bacterium]|nr:imidazole glycerol phosphate synthase subunit HisF [Magnetococcales bacterium]
MLKTRLIPTLLWKNFGLVKGVSFDSWRRIGTVLPAIKVYNTRDVDELVLLDIAATDEGREPDYESIEELAAECFVPFTIGGGITETAHIRNLLKAGADKVVINSAAYENPQLIQQGANQFGAQCIVASIDAKRTPDGSYRCFSHCGSKKTNQHPANWAQTLEQLGAGEILITSVDEDGVMNGYDLPLIKAISQRVSIPVIASGGAGHYSHFVEAIQQAGASAVAAASMFHFTEQTPAEGKQHMAEKGIAVRNIRIIG